MHPIWRFTLTAIAAAAIALAVLAVPVLFRDGGEAPAEPTPTPGLRAKAGQIRTLPNVSPATRKAVTTEIGAALVKLYELAFATPHPSPGPDGSPLPRPAVRVRPSLTKIATKALARSPAVFDEASDLEAYTGSVTFSGVIVFDSERPFEALVDVDFGGEAVPAGSRSPAVKIRQIGTVQLKNTADGWLVDGFDLRIATRPLNTPTPSPR